MKKKLAEEAARYPGDLDNQPAGRGSQFPRVLPGLPTGMGHRRGAANDRPGLPDNHRGSGKHRKGRGPRATWTTPAASFRPHPGVPGRGVPARKTHDDPGDHRDAPRGPEPLNRPTPDPNSSRPVGPLCVAPYRGGRVLLLCLFLLAFVSSCGAAGSLGGSPSETTLAVYDAADDGDLDELETFFSEELAEGMEGPIGSAIGGTPGMADHLARGGAIEEIRVEDEDISGDLARITVFIRYDQGEVDDRNAGDAFGEDNPVEQTLPLIREDGVWKVSADYLRGV